MPVQIKPFVVQMLVLSGLILVLMAHAAPALGQCCTGAVNFVADSANGQYRVEATTEHEGFWWHGPFRYQFSWLERQPDGTFIETSSTDYTYDTTDCFYMGILVSSLGNGFLLDTRWTTELVFYSHEGVPLWSLHKQDRYGSYVDARGSDGCYYQLIDPRPERGPDAVFTDERDLFFLPMGSPISAALDEQILALLDGVSVGIELAQERAQRTLDDLVSDDPAVWPGAVEALRVYGMFVLAELQAVAADSSSPEAAARADQVLETIRLWRALVRNPLQDLGFLTCLLSYPNADVVTATTAYLTSILPAQWDGTSAWINESRDDLVWVDQTYQYALQLDSSTQTQEEQWPDEIESLIPDESGFVMTIQPSGFEAQQIGLQWWRAPSDMLNYWSGGLFRVDEILAAEVNAEGTALMALYGDDVFGHNDQFEQVIQTLTGSTDVGRVRNQLLAIEAATGEPPDLEQLQDIHGRLQTFLSEPWGFGLGVRVALPSNEVEELQRQIGALLLGQGFVASGEDGTQFTNEDEVSVLVAVRNTDSHVVIDLLRARSTTESLSAQLASLEATTRPTARPSGPSFFSIAIDGATARHISTLLGFNGIVDALDSQQLPEEFAQQIPISGTQNILSAIHHLWPMEQPVVDWSMWFREENAGLTIWTEQAEPIPTISFVEHPDNSFRQFAVSPTSRSLQLVNIDPIGTTNVLGVLGESGILGLLSAPLLMTTVIFNPDLFLIEDGLSLAPVIEDVESAIIVGDFQNVDVLGLLGRPGETLDRAQVWLGCLDSGGVECEPTATPVGSTVAFGSGLLSFCHISELEGRPIMWVGETEAEVTNAATNTSIEQYTGLAQLQLSSQEFSADFAVLSIFVSTGLVHGVLTQTGNRLSWVFSY